MDTFTLSLPVICIICFFVFLAGFVDAAAGGGGLISLPAYLATGIPAHMAYGCNKFSSACGTTLASLRFLKNRAMDVQTALLAAAGSFIGSGVAARIVLTLDDQFLKRIVIVFSADRGNCYFSESRIWGRKLRRLPFKKEKGSACTADWSFHWFL